MKVWLSLQEIAEELEIPVSSIYHYRRMGMGPKCYQFGKHVRVHIHDFIQWKEENQIINHI